MSLWLSRTMNSWPSYTVFAVLCVLVSTGPVTAGMDQSDAQHKPLLFQYLPEADLSASQRSRLHQYREDPTAAHIEIVRLEMARLTADRSVIINLFESETLHLSGFRLEKRTSDQFSVFGNPVDEHSSVTLVIDGADAFGTIRNGRNLYAVRPLGGGMQALILQDQQAFPPDEPPEFSEEFKK